MSENPVVIISAKRTPVGSFQGNFSDTPTTELGAVVLKSLLEDTGLSKQDVQKVMMGCVLPANLGQAPARQAALAAGLSPATNCVTVNKVCGSGMVTMMLSHHILMRDEARVVLAGGMENMTRAPYMLDKARSGYRMGDGIVRDHMMFDGLQDAYDGGCAMGVFADNTAERYSFSREAQDAFAIESGKRAQKAIQEKAFKKEIAPVSVQTRKGTLAISEDEPPTKMLFDKIPKLKPAFKKDGTVTAANASSISDGAAAVMMMRQSEAEKRGLKPRAVIRGLAAHSQEPEWFTLAPIGAMQKLFQKTGWSEKDVDLFEINEAFAVVTMAAMKDLNLPHEKVNIHGGACALGHPIGASGARLVVTLLHALETHGLKRGVASLCIGGGEATALAIELV